MTAQRSCRRINRLVGRFGLLLLALFAMLLVSATPPARAAEKMIPYEKIEQLCHQFHEVMPPPPPVEALLIGTFDYATGQFTWGPKVYAKKSGPPDAWFVDLSSPFADLKIRAIQPNLDPAITSLGSAWGTSAAVNNIISSAVNVNVGAGVGTGSGVIGSGATSAGGAPAAGGAGGAAPRSAPAPAPAPGVTRRGKAPGSGSGSSNTGGGGGGGGSGGTITGVDTTAVVNALKPIVGHSTNFQKLYVPARSGCIDMVFKVLNAPAGAPISATCEKRTATANGDQVDLVIPARVYAQFSLKVGDKNFDDTIIFDRPPVLGCFTLEAMPISIVYEPPGSNSSQKYTTIKTVGTSLETFTSSTNSATEPVKTDFSNVTEAIDLIGKVGKIVEKVRPEVGKNMQTASEVLSAAWGSSKTDDEISTTLTDDRKLSMQVTKENWVSTSTHQGPGKGDVFYFMIKPTFIWLAVQDEKTNSVYITVALLGYKGTGALSADLLRQATNPIPPKEMQALMLKLDPMAAEYDPGAARGSPPLVNGPMKVGSGGGGDPLKNAISRGRLVYSDFYVFGGNDGGQSIEKTVEESDTHTEVQTETVTTTESAGFLSYVARNVPQDGEKKVSTVHGSAAGNKTSATVKVEVQYGTGEQTSEVHNLDVYYDRLFGTFAFQEAQVSEEQQVSGQAMTSGDQPASRQPIELIGPDGKRIAMSKTDDKGNFHLASPKLDKGTYKLRLGAKEVPLEYKGQAIKGLKLDLGAASIASVGGGGGTAAPAGAGGGATGQTASSGTKTKIGKGGLDGLDPGTKPTVNETANTAGAMRGRPDSSAGYATTPNAALKGRLGRIVVAFPKDSPCKETHVAIRRAGEDKNVQTFYGSGEQELMPGKYTVLVNNKPITDVAVQSRNDSKVLTGVLHINAGKETHVELLDADGKPKLTSGYGEQQWGLPVGKYLVQVAGQNEPVEVKLDAVTEF